MHAMSQKEIFCPHEFPNWNAGRKSFDFSEKTDAPLESSNLRFCLHYRPTGEVFQFGAPFWEPWTKEEKYTRQEGDAISFARSTCRTIPGTKANVRSNSGKQRGRQSLERINHRDSIQFLSCLQVFRQQIGGFR
jgi:hypothetical protein